MTTTARNSNFNQLALTIKKLNKIKWLLNLENSDNEFILSDLQKEIDYICYHNFWFLVKLNQYLSQMSLKINNSIDKIVDSKNNIRLCRKLYFDYLKDFNRKPEFKEFQRYIFMDRATNMLKDLPPDLSFEELTMEALNARKLQLIVLYNILDNDSSMLFATKDIVENLPQLVYWVKENKYKPIKDLTADEYEILAGCIYGLSFDEMFEILNLSSFVSKYQDINNIITNLPAKFGVSNLTQVLFRILLLKPHIWSQGEHIYVIQALFDLKEALKDN